MYLTILVLPLLGSLTAGFGGRFLGGRGAALISTTCVGITFLLSLTAFYEVALCQAPVSLRIMPWITMDGFDAWWGCLYDPLTVVMLVVITSVSTLVHFYSIGYMSSDPHLPRFMSYLSIFTFFMLMLVTGDNFLQLFFGWEGVGLASYLLINFWYTRIQANKAAIKAMLMNRVGDIGLALGIFGCFLVFKTVEYQPIFACVPVYAGTQFTLWGYEVDALTTIGLFLFLGAVGKSAQLGLHTWLPDAMEGPTPVSALIHAATMVTAGVFLVARCSPLFEYAPGALSVVALVGGMTAFFAATTGVVQNDLKRVIAYSTCSQLGYMVFACGLGAYAVGVFHLMTHAFFKALLFLSAGVVIHGVGDEQDMRKMGGYVKLLPISYAMMTLGSLALVGFPFLAGFYSKDAILETAYAQYSLEGNAVYVLGLGAAFCTSYYSFRLAALTFLGRPNAQKPVVATVHEGNGILVLPLVVLALGAMFAGYLGKDAFIGLGTDFWQTAIYVHPQTVLGFESEMLHPVPKALPLVVTILGALCAFVLNGGPGAGLTYAVSTSPVGRLMYIFLNKRWLVDKVYNDFLGTPALRFGYETTFKALDKGVIELLGPIGVSDVVLRGASVSRSIHSGILTHATFGILLGVTLGILWVGSSMHILPGVEIFGSVDLRMVLCSGLSIGFLSFFS